MANRMEAFHAKVKERGWVCPQPQKWHAMWELLPNKSRKGAGWEPPLPLILAAWWETSNLEKMLRFDQHLRWAVDHGSTEAVLDYLEALTPEDWHSL
jgi:hypothetical protein